MSFIHIYTYEAVLAAERLLQTDQLDEQQKALLDVFCITVSLILFKQPESTLFDPVYNLREVGFFNS
jgi:hypothetical protein